LSLSLIEEGRVQQEDIGLIPAFYIDPAVIGFLPEFLIGQAHEAGNWVLHGLVEPIHPGRQRVLRGLGISGPLWRLFQKTLIRKIYSGNFKRPETSWGDPRTTRKII